MSEYFVRFSEGKQNNRLAQTGFILGLLAVLLHDGPFILLPLLGIVFSGVGLGTFDHKLHKNRWMAKWGLGLSIVFVLTAIVTVR